MTTELIYNLIGYYKDTISEIKKEDDMVIIRNIILNRHVHLGICYCAFHSFNTPIYSDKWVYSKKSIDSGFWYRTPQRSKNKEEILESLQVRVEIMQSFLITKEVS